jgi:photosystem I P700 chlorophyll a apoprotein A2
MRVSVAKADPGRARFLLLSGLSILWFGHLEAVAIPFSRRESRITCLGSIMEPFQDAWGTFLSAKWYLYGKFIDAPAHIPGSSLGAGRASLTFLGGLEPITGSLFVGDQAHHHLAIGFIFLSLTEAYLITPLRLETQSVNTNSNYARSEALESLAGAGGGLAIFTSAVAQHIYSMTPYYYLSYDYYA